MRKYILPAIRVAHGRVPGDNERVPDELFYNDALGDFVKERRLSDYTIENKQGLPTLDFGKLEKLSDEEFRKIQIRENEIFIQEHIKQKGEEPFCLYCTKDIKKPEELIRLQGTSLCLDCFTTFYDSSKDDFSESEKKYFNRIIEVFQN